MNASTAPKDNSVTSESEPTINVEVLNHGRREEERGGDAANYRAMTPHRAPEEQGRRQSRHDAQQQDQAVRLSAKSRIPDALEGIEHRRPVPERHLWILLVELLSKRKWCLRETAA